MYRYTLAIQINYKVMTKKYKTKPGVVYTGRLWYLQYLHTTSTYNTPDFVLFSLYIFVFIYFVYNISMYILHIYYFIE